MSLSISQRGMVWRGELAAAIVWGENAAEVVAENLGLVEKESEPRLQMEKTSRDVGDSGVLEQVALTPAPAAGYPDNLADAAFWQPFRYEARAEIPVESPHDTRLQWTAAPESPPPQIAITAKRVVHPRLRTAVSSLSPGRGLDLTRIVRSIARAETLHEFPRKHLRRWGQQILIVLDRSDRLVPFFQDQELLCEQLEALTPQNAITELFTVGPESGFVQLLDGTDELADYEFDTPARVVLISDLGVLHTGDSARLQRRWCQWGRKLLEQGFHLAALVPFPAHLAGSDLRQTFSLVDWQRSAQDYVQDKNRRSQLVDELLTAVSPAVRLEPGLLRAIRTAISVTADASIEADVWQHPAVTSRNPDAAMLDRQAVEKRYSPAFSRLPRDRRARILCELRTWRFDFANSPEVWFEEILNLDSDSQQIIAELFPSDLEDGISAIQYLAEQAKRKEASRYVRMVREYGGRAAERLSESAWRDPRIRQAVHDLWDAAPRKSLDKRGIDPALLGGKGELITVKLTQRGGEFQFVAGDRDATSLVAELRTRNRWIELATVQDDKNQFWKDEAPPKWATDWGWDEYGAWAEFKVDRHFLTTSPYVLHGDPPIKQRLRWIPPGKLLMGSPKDEEGYWDDQVPQHEVTISRGFWMFDTPVQQELWRAVMGRIPSEFKAKQSPVESVSWDNAQEFVKRLSEKLGEFFSLPTEAQWEYACRAGTRELWKIKSDPNPWGLFHVHGNLLEWCQDRGSDDDRAETVNSSARTDSQYRVLRRGVRRKKAKRNETMLRSHNFEDGYQNFILGFRCAQVQGAAEPTREDGEAAEPQDYPTSGGEAAALKIDSGAPRQIAIPAGPAIVIHSDVDSLELRRVTRPRWAKSIGRDRYGLWAEFSVEDGREQETHVVQRMRWIPPGRFLMGSPDDDEMTLEREKPEHEVRLGHGFWLFDTPVTQQLWIAVMKSNPSEFEGRLRPVETVSWNDCHQFLDRINQRIEDLDLTLPTEAEWEFACRAGTTTRSAFGDEITKDQANFWQELGQNESSNVKTFAPNAWGLFDMHGNVLEWCRDWYGSYRAGSQVNPQGPSEGHLRVLRGGAWSNFARRVRSAYRSYARPGDRFNYIGFRCAQVQKASREDASEMSEGLGESMSTEGSIDADLFNLSVSGEGVVESERKTPKGRS